MMNILHMKNESYSTLRFLRPRDIILLLRLIVNDYPCQAAYSWHKNWCTGCSCQNFTTNPKKVSCTQTWTDLRSLETSLKHLTSAEFQPCSHPLTARRIQQSQEPIYCSPKSYSNSPVLLWQRNSSMHKDIGRSRVCWKFSMQHCSLTSSNIKAPHTWTSPVPLWIVSQYR